MDDIRRCGCRSLGTGRVFGEVKFEVWHLSNSFLKVVATIVVAVYRVDTDQLFM